MMLDAEMVTQEMSLLHDLSFSYMWYSKSWNNVYIPGSIVFCKAAFFFELGSMALALESLELESKEYIVFDCQSTCLLN
jgi:hypothetical protein